MSLDVNPTAAIIKVASTQSFMKTFNAYFSIAANNLPKKAEVLNITDAKTTFMKLTIRCLKYRRKKDPMIPINQPNFFNYWISVY
jgi:hypothetical protein